MQWFKGKPGVAAEAPVQIDSIDRKRIFGPEDYEADAALVEAVNVALLLDQPLLLSGEPGTGKTQLAEKLALELGLGEPFKFETKASSTAQELFYTFDHIARFHAAQANSADRDITPLRFIRYNALGRAVLQSLPPAAAGAWFHGSALPDWYQGPRRAVVLIDEIDKAPSDFPNDMLNEIERHYFRVHELDDREAHADPRLRPIVVITSNSEKQLPEAFLRRCIFHHLNPIDLQRLASIASRRLAKLDIGSGPLLDEALDFFFKLRGYDMRKRPSTYEFLSFMTALSRVPGVTPSSGLTPELVRPLLSTLVKAPEDQQAALAHPLFGVRPV